MTALMILAAACVLVVVLVPVLSLRLMLEGRARRRADQPVASG